MQQASGERQGTPGTGQTQVFDEQDEPDVRPTQSALAQQLPGSRQTPAQQTPEPPVAQVVPSGSRTSDGQVKDEPLQVSRGSHRPVEGRQTTEPVA